MNILKFRLPPYEHYYTVFHLCQFLTDLKRKLIEKIEWTKIYRYVCTYIKCI